MWSSLMRPPRAVRIVRSRLLVFFLSFLLVATSVLLPVSFASPQESDSRANLKKRASRVEFVPGEILVRFRTEDTAANKERAIAPLRANNQEIALDVKAFEGSEIVQGLRLASVEPGQMLDAIEALNKRDDVLYAEPNYIWRSTRTPNDPRFPEMYAMRSISAEAAWNITTGDRSVVVGVVDGGIDVNHPDLQANIWKNPGETPGNGIDDDGNGYIDDVNGYDFHNNDSTVYDSPTIDDHGTHVAGTIGAVGDNGLGVTGVNWQVSIMSLKVLGTEDGGGSTSNIIRAYRYAKMMRERGVNLRVLNNSYGGEGNSQAALDAILELNGAGILFVAAAGNNGTDNFNFPHFPSNYDAPNILAVASTDSSDNISGFSNFGARVVSMGAPGSRILSTVPNSGYASFSGTSMATPHVTGAAALVLAANPNLTPQQLRGVLAFSGDVLPSLQAKTTTGRRLNVYRSILSAQENDNTAPAAAGNLRVTSQNGRDATLAWTAPGDDGEAGTASDYDLFFINPANGLRTHLPPSTFLLPTAAGTQQSVTVSVPYRNFAGTIELRAYDNAGNFSATSVNISVPQNAGSDPYVVNLEAASALSTGGTPLNLIGDDVYRESYPLPFTFSYFGQNYNTITVSSNGALYFSRIPRDSDDPSIGLDAGSTIAGLAGQTMIAGLWDDLRTDRGGDVFVVLPDADRVIFRWKAVTYDTRLGSGGTRGENPVNFEIELRRDGAIIFRYGDGNTKLFPVVGISGGEPDAYVIESHTSENSTKSLTNAQTVTFATRPAVVTYAISGSVKDAFGNNLKDVTVMLGGSASATTRTDANGNYSFASLPAGGNYAVTVSGSFFAFSSPTQAANNLGGNQTLNFTAQFPQVNNPIDSIDGFVRQQYLDFLSREPDATGFEFWKSIMRQRYAGCGAGAGGEQCRARAKASVSEAFFVSVEFQQTGYLVYRFYVAGFDPAARPRGLPRFNEFINDARTISAGVVVNEAGWEQKLEANKQQFARDFVQRGEFAARYPVGMSAQAFVDALYQTAGLETLRTESERQAAITAYGAGDTDGRARALRAVAESNLFFRKEFNKAFVLMQYFGYLRRNPNEGQDANIGFTGYDFWLKKLNDASGDTTRLATIDELLAPTKSAGMVEAFVITGEYRRRFGPE